MCFCEAISEDDFESATSNNAQQPEKYQIESRARVEEIFDQIADLPVDARSQYFAEQNIDPATRREVEALMAFDSASSISLGGDIGAVAQLALAQLEPRAMHCGPYRLQDLLGRGGMGTVYLAERVDGELAQRVAIKLLPTASDDPLVRQRFLTERQILADLRHPNIATLLDAGHRDDGQPYLVMEYVEGKTIDAYCGQLDTRQTITLFLQVCAAIGYLHRNLVVHRDLKPANIVVSTQGEPKLLDFGIAKLLDVKTNSTMTSMRMFTPDYASPEQVAGGPITTSSDIYSLGAVLYKLLTGASPHLFDDDSVGAVTKAICSGRIRPPSKLAPQVNNDLEAIVMKALRREPQERYATIEQFSEDLENYLQSRAIRARKGDSWYRTRKLLHRHWLSLTATTLTLAGLSAGVLVINHQRAIAQSRFSDVRQLANLFLFDFERAIRDVPGTLDARKLVVTTSQQYLRRLRAESRHDPALDREIAESYERLANIQTSIQSAGGESPGDTDSLLQSVKIRQRLGDDRAKNPALRRKYIELLSDLGYRYQDEHSAKEAARWADEAMDLSHKWVTAEPQNVDALAAATAAFMKGATTGEVGGQIASALGSLEKAVAYGERARALAPKDEALSFSLAEAYVIFCDLLVDLRRYSDALTQARHSLQLMEPLRVQHPDNSRFRVMFLDANSAVGIAERRLGETDPRHLQSAAPFLERAFALAGEAMRADPRNAQSKADFIVHCTRLALLLASLKKFDAAARTYESAYRVARELVVLDPKSRRNWYLLGKTQLDLGWTYMENKEPLKARASLLQADEGFSRSLLLDPADSITLESRASQFEAMARLTWTSGDVREARRWMLQSLDVMRGMIRRDPSARSYIGEYGDKLKLAREIGVPAVGF
jgi:serine/threonine protein kinase